MEKYKILHSNELQRTLNKITKDENNNLKCEKNINSKIIEDDKNKNKN